LEGLVREIKPGESGDFVKAPTKHPSLILILFGFVAFFALVADAQGLTVGHGELVGLETIRRTLTVEVPTGSQLLTVGGPLSRDAVLKIRGVKAPLDAFRVGDIVTVGWKRTSKGPLIVLLEAVYSTADAPIRRIYYHPKAKTVVGTSRLHVIKRGETLLDVARRHDLGFNEMEDLYPHVDPWIPPEGMELVIPSRWVLPASMAAGMVINVAEMRLYHFTTLKKHPIVSTFPIGVGGREWPTPIGDFKVVEKSTRPTWFIPPALRGKYRVKSIPPGPGNPLGDYWIGLGNSGYGIHGTDIPWSVGRLVTLGCIRLYPEDIKHLFNLVKVGTPVKIVYEPVKFGLVSGKVYVEVHRDVYGLIDDFAEYGYQRLQKKGLLRSVDFKTIQQALVRQDGLPLEVTRQGR
jgi:L,D-transpeptidase ErfK/SrfK